MALRWYSTVVDCRDVHALARWWAGVLDWQLIYEADDEAAIIPRHVSTEPPGAEGWTKVSPGLVFGSAPEPKTVKNRLHIDLAPHTDDDREAEIARLLDLGATRVDVGQGEQTWDVFADPEGNEFCVLSARDR